MSKLCSQLKEHQQALHNISHVMVESTQTPVQQASFLNDYLDLYRVCPLARYQMLSKLCLPAGMVQYITYVGVWWWFADILVLPNAECLDGIPAIGFYSIICMPSWLLWCNCSPAREPTCTAPTHLYLTFTFLCLPTNSLIFYHVSGFVGQVAQRQTLSRDECTEDSR